jgi:hypothetical protein
LNTEYRGKLDALVAALLEHETLDAKDVVTIFGPSGPIDIEAGMQPQLPETIEAAASENEHSEKVEPDTAAPTDESLISSANVSSPVN